MFTAHIFKITLNRLKTFNIAFVIYNFLSKVGVDLQKWRVMQMVSRFHKRKAEACLRRTSSARTTQASRDRRTPELTVRVQVRIRSPFAAERINTDKSRTHFSIHSYKCHFPLFIFLIIIHRY